MPTHRNKVKSKRATTKTDIKIKSQDLHPLTYYIDDRVELIRQIFMTLKSKTIKAIAPDFLQVNLYVNFRCRKIKLIII